MVALGGLGAAIGGAVAPHHVGRTVAEQMLDVELAGVVGDGPRRERVAEAVGVHLWDAGVAAERAQADLEAVNAQADAGMQAAVARTDEERPGGGAAIGEVVLERGGAVIREGDDPRLVPLAVADMQPPRGEVAVA